LTTSFSAYAEARRHQRRRTLFSHCDAV